MLTLRHFTVIPRLPPALERLRDIAYNLWWSWAPVGQDLFIRVDRRPVGSRPRQPNRAPGAHRPGAAQRARDRRRVHEPLESAWQTFQRYMQRERLVLADLPGRGGRAHRVLLDGVRHPRVPAHLFGRPRGPGRRPPQDASDLGLPLVGVGLAYAEGYFRQALNTDGWQGERYPINDWHRMPVSPRARRERQAAHHRRKYPQGIVHAQLWKVQVGRVPLYLLDANLAENAAADRSITGPLYGGDRSFASARRSCSGSEGCTRSRPSACRRRSAT